MAIIHDHHSTFTIYHSPFAIHVHCETDPAPAGPVYAASPNPKIGKKIKGRNINPTVNPSSLPKLLDNKLVVQMPMTIFTTGMIRSSSHHQGFPMILNKTRML